MPIMSACRSTIKISPGLPQDILCMKLSKSKSGNAPTLTPTSRIGKPKIARQGHKARAISRQLETEVEAYFLGTKKVWTD